MYVHMLYDLKKQIIFHTFKTCDSFMDANLGILLVQLINRCDLSWQCFIAKTSSVITLPNTSTLDLKPTSIATKF